MLMGGGIKLCLGVEGVTSVQRKVFRVEQMFGERRTAAQADDAGTDGAVDRLKALHALGERRDLAGDEVMRELVLVREVIARNRAELAVLIGENNVAPNGARGRRVGRCDRRHGESHA